MDRVPFAGAYVVYNAEGEQVGTLLTHVGGVFPPFFGTLCYYERLEESPFLG